MARPTSSGTHWVVTHWVVTHWVERMSLPQRRGEAFCALPEAIPSDRLPSHGGTATSMVVMIDIDSLTSAIGTARLSTGGAMTGTEVRRLACTAKVRPAGLGGAGEILDLGRSRRLFSSAQHKAMAIRCSIPAADVRSARGELVATAEQ